MRDFFFQFNANLTHFCAKSVSLYGCGVGSAELVELDLHCQSVSNRGLTFGHESDHHVSELVSQPVTHTDDIVVVTTLSPH